MERSWDDYAESLTYFDTLHVYFNLLQFFYFSYAHNVICRIFRTVIVLFNPNQ
jgi:hypothetical protein